MVMRSLAFSVFILIMSLTFTLVNALNQDIMDARNETGGGYLNTQTPPKELTDLSWDGNSNNLTVWGLNQMANTQEVQGGSFGKVSATSILYNTLFYSTTGFDDFLRTLFGITNSSWDGTTVVVLIDLAMVLVILNHGFVLLQLFMNLFGVL